MRFPRSLVAGLLTLAGTVAVGQAPPLWTSSFNGTGNAAEGKAKLAVDSQGNTLVISTSMSASTENDVVTQKISPSGAVLWTQGWNNTKQNQNDSAEAVTVDAQGNSYVLMTTWNDLNMTSWDGTVINAGTEYDIVTVKYSPTGAKLWEKWYDDPIHWQDFGVDIELDPQGNVVVLGQSTSRAPSNHPVAPDALGGDFVTIKYSPSGQELWSKTWNGTDQLWEIPYDMALDGTGNVFVSGTTQVWRGGSTHDLVTIKYSSAGSQLWVKRNLGEANMRVNGNVPRRIKADANGNLIIAAWHPLGVNGRDVLMLKYDPAGALLWSKTWGRELEDVVYDMVIDSAGNALVGVSTEPVPGVGYPASDSALLKFSPSGTLLWSQFYNGPDDLWDGDNVMAVDSLDNLYMGLQAAAISYDYTVLKYTPGGTMEWWWKWDNPDGKDDQLTDMKIDKNGVLRLTGGAVSPTQDFNTLTLALDPKTVTSTVVPNIRAVTISPSTVSSGQPSYVTVTLSNAAPVGGSSIRMACSNPTVAWLSGFLDIPHGQTSGTLRIETGATSPRSVTISATYNRGTMSSQLGIGQPTAGLQSLSLSSSTVQAGTEVAGTVRLATAPTQAVTLGITDNTTVITTPSSVQVPAGSTSAKFPINTYPVSTTATRQISASLDGVVKTANLTIQPGPQLVSLAISPATVKGGEVATATITLSRAAPTGGTVVWLSDNSSVLSTPTAVTVPAGSITASFPITTSAVSTTATRQVYATLGVKKTANISLTP